MPVYNNVNGVWKENTAQYTRVSGVWREIDKAYTRVSGVWRESYSSESPWDITKATHTYTKSGITNAHAGIAIVDNGTRMYTACSDNRVRQYSLSTAWDVSTAGYVQTKNMSTWETNLYDVKWTPDGNFWFNVGYGSDEIHKFTTDYIYNSFGDWNINYVYFALKQHVNVNDTAATPMGLCFKPDGTKVYVTGYNRIVQYNLLTAWDLSTLTYVNTLWTSSADRPCGIYINPDGTDIFTPTINSPYLINRYSLSTPWDITSASIYSQLDITSIEPYPRGIDFKPDGTKMYISGRYSQSIHEFKF